VFLAGTGDLSRRVEELRRRAPETKIIIEAESVKEAVAVARSGADVVQLDKVPPEELAKALGTIRAARANLLVSVAGGINEANAAQYASAGADLLVLSSVYFGKPSDIGVRLEPCSPEERLPELLTM
jgi:molybdenum transport protein